MRQPLCGLPDERGFSLIEAVVAMAIFATVATGLAGVLTSSISARSLASQRTAAEQIANDQLEWIRSLGYTQVGLSVNGNPSGIVNPTGDQSANGGPTVPAGYTVSIDVFWVDDPNPTSFTTRANYKNVVVTVSRTSSSKQLSSQSTQVGPRQRAAFGGINKGIVLVQVQDYLTNAPFPNVMVNLLNGPSSPLGDTTDAAGLIFPALTATTGSVYYDLVVPPFSGYIMLPEPSITHFQLAPGETTPTKVLRLYKPVTLTASFNDSDGTPFVGTVVFTVTNSRGSKSYTYSGTPVTVPSITNSVTGATELLVPGPYTVTVTNQAAASFYTAPVTQDVPETLSDYPTDLTGTVTLTADPLGSIRATVTSAGGPVTGATVTVAGGPRSIAARTATTNASGIATISGLPAGSGYTVTAAKGGESAPNQSASVGGGTTTDLTFVFPTGSLKAVVTWATVPVAGATVTLSGGPGGISLSRTSDVNGEAVFSDIPAGSGYTLSAVKSGQTASVSPTVVGFTTTTVPVAMPTLSLVATVTWVGANVSGATVTLSGGPLSLSPVSATTAGSGQITFSAVPAGSGYTLSATRSGATTTLSSQTFTTSPTTSVGIALPTGTIAVNAATWAGQPAGSATVTISGGPMSPTTYTGSTNASGVANITVPATTSTNPYTVTVTKTAGSVSGSGTATVTSLASGATATVAPALTPTGTIAVNAATWAGRGAGGATVTITGGANVGATYTGTTNSAGVVSIAVPITSSANPYTVTVTKNGGTGTATVTSLASGATATVAPAMTPTKVIRVTVRRGSPTLSILTNTSVSVSITGGPNGAVGAAPAYGGTATTDTNGRVSFTVPSGTGGYTVKVNVATCGSFASLRSNSAAGVSSTGTTTTNVTIDLTGNACPFTPLP